MASMGSELMARSASGSEKVIAVDLAVSSTERPVLIDTTINDTKTVAEPAAVPRDLSVFC
jgi:hypothetical protein